VTVLSGFLGAGKTTLDVLTRLDTMGARPRAASSSPVPDSPRKLAASTLSDSRRGVVVEFIFN
jgi:hypothetical protein